MPETESHSIFFQSTVLSAQAATNGDCLVRIKLPELCKNAKPGNYVECKIARGHVYKASVIGIDKTQGFVDLYFISKEANSVFINTGDNLSVSHPLGETFSLDFLMQEEAKPVLMADLSGMASIFFLAEVLRNEYQIQPVVFLYSESQFPFTPKPSQFVIAGLPAGVLATCSLLEDKKIPARLLSDEFIPGCYHGDMLGFIDEIESNFWLDCAVFAAGERDFLKRFQEKAGTLTKSVQVIVNYE